MSNHGTRTRDDTEKEHHMTTTEKPAADNGVDVPFLLGARTALTETPAGAQFQWRAETEWVKGTQSRGTVKTFFGLGEEQEHSSTFTFDADHPLQFSSEDNGATPVEILLVALGACLTGGIASVAQLREIQLRSVKATIAGEHDILGILGADPEVPNRFKSIKVHYDIDADATPDEIAAVVAQSQKRSAVYDSLTNPVAVTVEVN
jgi:uncharacterized OsmC-like protein